MTSSEKFIRNYYHPEELMDDLGYSEEIKFLFNCGSERQLASEYPELFDMLSKQAHCRDNRSIIDFAKNIISGWLIEDIILHFLKYQGLDIRLGGSDKNRSFCTKPTTAADFIINIDGVDYPTELQANTYDGYDYSTILLRDNKLINLMNRREHFLYVDMLTNTFVLFDMGNEQLRYEYIPAEQSRYNKPSYKLYCDKQFKELNIDNIKNYFLKYKNNYNN